MFTKTRPQKRQPLRLYPVFLNCCNFPVHGKTISYEEQQNDQFIRCVSSDVQHVVTLFLRKKKHLEEPRSLHILQGIVPSSSRVLFWHCLLCPESNRTSFCLREEAISLSRLSVLLRLRRTETLSCVGPQQTGVCGDNKDEIPRAPALEY